MISVFIKDIFDIKTVYKYMLISVFTYLVVRMNRYSVGDGRFTDMTLIYISVALLLSVFFFVRTYVKNDRVLLYYALPVSRAVINENVLLCIFIDTLIRKVTIAFAVMLGIGAGIEDYIKLLLLLPSIVVFGCVSNVSDVSEVKKILTALFSILYSFLTVIAFLVTNDLIATMSGIVMSFAYFFIIRKIFMETAIFRLVYMRNLSQYTLCNYFFKFFLAEKVYIINTIFIVAAIIFVSFTIPGEISFCLACAIGAVNTPLLTVFSTEKGLTSVDNMLPSTYKSLKKDYIFTLFVYFALVQVLIMMLHFDIMSLKLIVGLVVLTEVEVLITIYLEKKYPIQGYKTTTEVWRNPRKYILPAIVFVLAFIIGAV